MQLTDEQQMIRDLVREFAVQELAPLAPRLDAKGHFPAESIPKLAALNLLGLTAPQEHGGAGVDTLSYSIAIEEVARVCASTALVLAAHNSLGVAPLCAWGTVEQKQRFLGPLARGEKLASGGLAEPEAGSDLAATRTTAERRGDGWVLRGAKTFVPGARHADLFVVAARTGPPADGAGGLSLFLVEKDAPGLVMGGPQERLGLRGAESGDLRLDGVEVPGSALLGRENAGVPAVERLFDGARVSLAALALGLAQGAFERGLRYAREREQFEKPIAEFDAIRTRLADMATEIHTARLLVHDTSRLLDAGEATLERTAMAKLYASEVASRVCDHAIQIHGGYGYIVEYQVERYYRDAKLCEIAGGPSELQRLLIARELLAGADAGPPLLQ